MTPDCASATQEAAPGRRVRKTVGARPGKAPASDMVMIDTPAEAESKRWHWEGDLIVGVGSVSAMVTLRERKTQYGMVINLPDGSHAHP